LQTISETTRAPKTFDADFLRWLVWVVGGVPGFLLVWDALHGALGANGVNYALRTTGKLGLVFLIASLVVTPARRLSGVADIIAMRRSLGLFGFAYIAVHFAIFFGFDRAASIAGTVTEIVARFYLQIGFVALLLLLPLAITSTDRMQTRLGSKRWKRLHRLSYVIVTLGCIHFTLQVKSDLRQPIAFGFVALGLFAYRGVAAVVDARARRERKRRFWSGELRIVHTTFETPDVRTLRLAPQGGGRLPFSFAPGQYLNVTLSIGDRVVRRSYSISSSSQKGEYCEISVKRKEDGWASHHVHDALAEGQLLSVSGPAGRFTFDEKSSDVVTLIGGGVGITPLMSIVRSLADRKWHGRIELILTMRTSRDLIFGAELERLAAAMPSLHVTTTLTREKESDWNGRRGPITKELLVEILGPEPRGPIYICGPEAMMLAVRNALRELSVKDDDVLTEAFVSPGVTSPNAPTTSDDDSTHEVRFARQHLIVSAPGRVTLLEAAEDAGLDLPFECRSGICGRCKVKLLEGEVTMSAEDALSQTEKLEGVVLSCQARARTNVVVDV
jgi:ferredoxin-NADP reductase/DMSO/TMAO reductase YedYZ heme-binding membrane subunit